MSGFRDKHVAHSLVQTTLEKKGKVVVRKYGHEKELLDKTIDVTSEFYYGICDASFHWPSAWEKQQVLCRSLAKQGSTQRSPIALTAREGVYSAASRYLVSRWSANASMYALSNPRST